jgi:hypothetical protein
MAVKQLVFKGASFGVGTVSGLIAGALFKQVWKLARRQEDAPNATDEDRSWREVLAAAAVQGAIYALVKATVSRGGATAVRRVTGTWPTSEHRDSRTHRDANQ